MFFLLFPSDVVVVELTLQLLLLDLNPGETVVDDTTTSTVDAPQDFRQPSRRDIDTIDQRNRDVAVTGRVQRESFPRTKHDQK